MTLRPDPDHDAVCESDGRHLVVVAPPGTGKTCLAVRLAGQVVQQLLPFQRVLVLSFSNQARVQLEHEAARQLGPGVRGQVEITNYHAFFRREVWGHRRALGLPLDADIGSYGRRRDALAAVDGHAVAQLSGESGALEAFAEQRFEVFHDERTPEPGVRDRLLGAVDEELRAGRLVFDDLGALFWSLLTRFPSLEEAYKTRYPVVIADEHQDASELQDAVVRRLARKRVVVLADPMQLIYGFRGSKPERLERHLQECDGQFELRTPHRWGGDGGLGPWLVAVRERLCGRDADAPQPAGVSVFRVEHFNPMKSRARIGALDAFRAGCRSVAIIARLNRAVAEVRGYLCRNGLRPRQLGGDDFEEARKDIEKLPELAGAQELAERVIERLVGMIPTLESRAVEGARRRLGPDGINLRGRVGDETRELLEALQTLYDRGRDGYFPCLCSVLDAYAAGGHHLPRLDALRALRSTADTLAGTGAALDDWLAEYAQQVAVASQLAPRLSRGLFVLTAHQAKGKEFDAVIVFDASVREFPDTDEARRLFYVALTRATRRCVVIAPRRRASPLIADL